MLRALIALAAILPLSAASTAASPPSNDVERLVEPCRMAARASFNMGDPAIMDAYIENLSRYPERDRDERLACASYLAGARDMIEGRIIPIDLD